MRENPHLKVKMKKRTIYGEFDIKGIGEAEEILDPRLGSFFMHFSMHF